jgi:hypothetical protein
MSLRTMPQHFSFTGSGTQSGRADFGNNVRSAGAAVQGYNITYGNNDHHVRDLQVEASNVTMNGTVVTYDVTFKLRDGSNTQGNADINIVVFADVEAA